jgi:protease IV
MRDSIFYSALRALVVSFFVIVGLSIGFIFILLLVGVMSSSTTTAKLTTVHTEEILPNANGIREEKAATVPAILQINIDGVIGLENLTTSHLRQLLVESREGNFKDDRVKGIILYINTPGGTVTDANGIFEALKEYKEKYKVPIYAFVDGLCASGGMYIAMAADKIYSTDVSLIGSVGVIIPSFMNFTKLLDKIGVETLTISAGKDKDALNPLRPWKPGEENNYKQITDYFYDHFVNLMTTYRPKITKNELIEKYGARLFPSEQARQFGFIDESSAQLSTTLKDLLEQVNITDDQYQVIRLENKGWWKDLFSSKANVLNGTVEHRFKFTPEIDLMLKNQFLYLYYPH